MKDLMEFMAANPFLAFGTLCVICMTIFSICSIIAETFQYRRYMQKNEAHSTASKVVINPIAQPEPDKRGLK